jgi:predicted dehydrogenase
MSKLRGAIIGCGMISEFHLRGWARTPGVEIVALADPERSRAEQRRLQFAAKARLHEGLEALLEKETVDFVDILSPPWLHREHCLLAAQAGVHIICQKPLCDRREEAVALVRALRDYPKLFIVHENHRYRPWFREIARLSQEGFFGRLHFLHLVQHDPAEPPEKNNLEAERGVLLQYGVHLVDMMRLLLGEPKRVQARLHHLNPRVRGESLAHVVFDYPQATATLDVSWKAVGVQQGGALLVGESGEAFYEGRMTRSESARFRLSQGSSIVRDEQRSPYADYVESFCSFEREFVESVLSNRPGPQPAIENLKTLEATFAAYEAARRGEPVVLAEFATKL